VSGSYFEHRVNPNANIRFLEGCVGHKKINILEHRVNPNANTRFLEGCVGHKKINIRNRTAWASLVTLSGVALH